MSKTKEPPRGQRLIIRERGPLNLESPFSELKSFLTPTDSFFISNPFAAATLKAATHQFEVEGAVKTPLNINLRELRQMPCETVLSPDQSYVFDKIKNTGR